MIRLLRRHPVRDGDLSAYVDGRLRPGAERRVEAHLQTCGRCHRTVAELRSLKSMLSSLPTETPSRSFTLTPAMAAQEPRSAVTPAPRRPSLMLAPAVALAALVVLVGVELVAFNDDGGGAGSATNAFLAQDKAMERSSAGAPPPATAPSVQTPVAPMAGAADAAQPTPAAVTRQSEGPSITAPTPPAPADTSAASRVPGDDDEGRSIVRWLEVVAAGALVLSLAYVFWRVRSTPGG